MNSDFHYYATCCAALIAGYSHEESVELSYCDRMVDHFSETMISRIDAPRAAATTQLNLELMDARADTIGLQNITRIWSSFHFLPYDLNAEPPKRCSKRYRNKYRLICQPNGELLARTVRLAKGKGTQAAGVAMHVLADTWAHRNFAGTPSLVINNSNYHFYELIPDGDGFAERKITFRHSASAEDDLEHSIYTNTLSVNSEKSIMNLGHGRVGHLPDYCFARYKYLPAWGGYDEIVKDNPSDYRNAFCQMVYAMKYLRGEHEDFECGVYDTEAIKPWEAEIERILNTRQLSAEKDWKALGEKISGREIEPFDADKYINEYTQAETGAKDGTFLGKFIRAAMAQKSMVTRAVYSSGSKLAGYSVQYNGRRGMKDYREWLRSEKEGAE